jgi:hypothetical protein
MRTILERGNEIIETPIHTTGWSWNRHPFLMVIPRTEHLLQIFVRPSFKPEYAVDFYEPVSSRGIENVKCVISMTNQRIPFSYKGQPPSDLILRRKLVESIPEIAKQWLIKLPKIKVPLDSSDSAFGVDGVGYEVQIGNFNWGACRFEWWVRPPSQWSEIGRMAQEILTSLEDEINELRDA